MSIAVSGTELAEGEGVARLVALAQAAGATAVEMWYPKNYTAAGVSATEAALRVAGLGIACIATPSSLYGPGRAAGLELLTTAIRMAEQCGAGLVNTYFGHAEPGRAGVAPADGRADDRAAVESYADAVRPIVAEAADRGVQVVLENEFDAFGWDPRHTDVTRRPAALAALVEAVGSPAFGLTFDPANAYCAGVDPVGEAYPLLRRHIRYVHVKDVARSSGVGTPTPAGWVRYVDGNAAFDTARLGAGAVDWPRLLSALLDDGFSGQLTLEPHCEPSILQTEITYAAGYLRSHLGVQTTVRTGR